MLTQNYCLVTPEERGVVTRESQDKKTSIHLKDKGKVLNGEGGGVCTL